MSDNISSIFGTTFLSSLIPVSVTLDIDAEGDVDDDNTLQTNGPSEDDPSGQISDVSGVERILPVDIAGES